MNKRIICTILLGLCSTILTAQDISIGSWRSHLNYSDSRLLAFYNGNVYVAAANGLFYYDTADNSINKLTKNDGFGDVGISTMAVSPDGQKLIIGYSSGHISILEGNELSGINGIKNIAGLNDKGIYDILFYNGMAYLCTGFGLAALDYERGLVKETYQNIGENGGSVSSTTGAVFRDSLFLATPEGIIATSIAASNNLMDFNNWVRLKTATNYPPSSVGLITHFNDLLYAHFIDSGLYVYDGITWEKADFPQELNIKRFLSISSELYIITGGHQQIGKIYRLNAQNQAIAVETNKISNPSDALALDDGTIWVADQERGLVADILGKGESMYPKGPASDKLTKLIYYENTIAGIENGLDKNSNQKNQPGKLAIYQQGEWQNYTSSNSPFLSGIDDFTDLSYDQSSSSVLISTFGSGIIGLNINSGEFYRPFDAQNPLFHAGNIAAVATDDNGVIWVNEYNHPDRLLGLIEGQWNDFPVPTARHVKEIKAVPYQYAWLRLDKGLMVIDPETGNMRELNVGNRHLIHDIVTTYAMDHYGYMWYGTPSGIAYINDQGELFEGGGSSVIPEYQNGNLFNFQQIDALEIDAANRKWIATSEGLWLFSEDGDSLISHFTENNSSLLSNKIFDIEINAASGEVFIATAKGLVSYRSNTSEGKTSHQQVKIFPNPVRPGFNGFIGIIGVVEGAIVKITDLSGNLVREVQAQGGTATWDGNTLSGRRVTSGVYLVFSASQDGKETFIGKIAFVN